MRTFLVHLLTTWNQITHCKGKVVVSSTLTFLTLVFTTLTCLSLVSILFFFSFFIQRQRNNVCVRITRSFPHLSCFPTTATSFVSHSGVLALHQRTSPGLFLSLLSPLPLPHYTQPVLKLPRVSWRHEVTTCGSLQLHSVDCSALD